MRAREIKAELSDSGVDTSDLFDKEDLANRFLTTIPFAGAIRLRLLFCCFRGHSQVLVVAVGSRTLQSHLRPLRASKWHQ